MGMLKEIIFLSDYDHTDIKAWSGINYHLLKELSKQSNIIDVGKISLPFLIKIYFLVVKSYFKFFRNKNFLYQRSRLYHYFIKRDIRKKISKYPNTPIVTTSSMIAGCIENNSNSIILYIDATFYQMIDYYPEFSEIPDKNISIGFSHEKEAFKKVTKILVASKWCQDSIINDYDIPQNKISIVGIPQNIDDSYLNKQKFTPRSNTPDITILFVGVDWLRKGGDVAVELCDYLVFHGFKVNLNIVGCSIPKVYQRNYIKCFGFLSKNNKEQSKTLHNLFYQSDILLVPSRYECFGIVYTEAATYGLMPIGNLTGGVNDSIVDSGLCLDFYSQKESSFEKIKSVMDRKSLDERRFKCYQEMRLKPKSYKILVNKLLKEVV